MIKFRNLLGLLAIVAIAISSCKDDTPEDTSTTYTFEASTATQADVQEAMILFEDGDKIVFGPGTFTFTSTLSVDSKTNLVIEGAGMNETILDFTDQISGAEGIKITNSDMVLMNGFTVQNAEGDGIKATDCEGITFYQVGAVWTGDVSQDNGAYGLYPVLCKHVNIDDCYVRGASDAGIYVGQSEFIHVKNSRVEENVAGIEIENSKFSEVFNNTAMNNTGGILIFDLPGLTLVNGNHHRVYNNTLSSNSHPNFAPAGNIVGSVPSGTGIMILAAKEVEVFNNTITNNNVMGIGVISYNVVAALGGLTWEDENYIPYCEQIHIHDNTMSRTNDLPTEQTDMGNFLVAFYSDGDLPHFIYDGWENPDLAGANVLCIENQANEDFVDLNADAGFALNEDVTPYLCQHERLSETSINAPTP